MAKASRGRLPEPPTSGASLLPTRSRLSPVHTPAWLFTAFTAKTHSWVNPSPSVWIPTLSVTQALPLCFC